MESGLLEEGRSEIWRAIDLSSVLMIEVEGHKGHRSDERVLFSGKFLPWGYIASATLPDAQPGRQRVRAHVRIHSGGVRFGILNQNNTDFLKEVWASGPGDYILDCAVVSREQPGSLVLRNGSSEFGSVIFELSRLEYAIDEPSEWRLYDMQSIYLHRPQSVTRTGGALNIEGQFQPWGYIASAIIPTVLCDQNRISVRAHLNIKAGSVALGVLSAKRDEFIVQSTSSGSGRLVLEVSAYCPEPEKSGGVIIRNGGTSNETAFVLEALEFRVPNSLPVHLPLKPPEPHPIFSQVPKWEGYSKPDYMANWVGTLTALKYVGKFGGREQFLKPSHPGFNEEYFEWIDILETVKAARASYTMIELGAGWGRWLVDAWSALRQTGKSKVDVTFVGVEAEPQHFSWMREHFIANGLDPNKHRLIEAAVSAADGTVKFTTGHAGDWYGQAIVSSEWRSNDFPEVQIKNVQAVSLKTVADGLSRINLIDMDIQGAEGEVIASSLDLLHDRVERVHIGTHSDANEESLRDSFRALGWICKADFRCKHVERTPYGLIRFGDGVQTWVNPRFC